MAECIFCGHPLAEHQQTGCTRERDAFRACGCRYAERPPLLPDATAAQRRERADWWHGHAQAAWELARAASLDLERWRQLMRFYLATRRVELAERQAAETLERSGMARLDLLELPGSDPARVAPQPASDRFARPVGSAIRA